MPLELLIVSIMMSIFISAMLIAEVLYGKYRIIPIIIVIAQIVWGGIAIFSPLEIDKEFFYKVTTVSSDINDGLQQDIIVHNGQTININREFGQKFNDGDIVKLTEYKKTYYGILFLNVKSTIELEQRNEEKN